MKEMRSDRIYNYLYRYLLATVSLRVCKYSTLLMLCFAYIVQTNLCFGII